ncbi:MAG TPA: shikimate kinase [Egibacteraceae bacterium]|nr:shikimate kinase [Egibacteraceae bacterium]
MSGDGARNIVLGGLMGTGKTTLARRLAVRLGRQWLDTDALVAQRAGCSIAQLFARRGEEAFRELEREVVAEAAELRRHIVSLGGGVLLDGGNVELLRAGGVVVLLVGDVAVLAERVTRAGVARRPLLAGETDVHGRLERLAGERRVAFEAAADHVEDTTDGRSADAIAASIVAWAATRPDVLTPGERKAVAA